MEAYREVIGIQPRNFLAHNNLGVLYDKKGPTMTPRLPGLKALLESLW
jgi:hypothetical protein